MNELPKNYTEGLPRVSSIVDFKFPFSVEDETRFTDWLWNKGISKDDYMNTATGRGTEIHNQLENYILGHKVEYKIKTIEEELNHGLDFIKQLKDNSKDLEFLPEYFIKTDKYQGTCDLVTIVGNKVFLYDWKTYGICKKKFNLPSKLLKNGKPGKPTDKIKKVSLQLSLYADYFRSKGYEIGGIYLVWLHYTGSQQFECDLWSKEDLDILLTKFLTKDIILPNFMTMSIKTPLRIELQTSPIAYSSIKVILDLKDLDSGQTPEEAINEAVEVQKKLHLSYIPKDEE